MSYPGRGARWSRQERQDVLRLRGEGVSIRQIALQVFGSVGLRGRVERILKASEKTVVRGVPDPVLDSVDLGGLSSAELSRLLVERAWVALARRPGGPRPGELKTMLLVQRQVEALEFVERERRKRGAGRETDDTTAAGGERVPTE